MEVTGHADLRFVNFNQDFSCFYLASRLGVHLYESDPLHENRTIKPYDDDPDGISVSSSLQTPSGVKARADQPGNDVLIAEMLYRCNCLLLVFAHKPHIVTVWDDLRKRRVFDLEFGHEVKAVRLRRDKIVVVMKHMVKVYGMGPSFQHQHVWPTYPNPQGAVALSTVSDRSYLAFPSQKQGEVQIMDLHPEENAKEERLLKAHENPITRLSFNGQATLLATASESGTLIRIFDTRTLEQLRELRRGTQAALILSMNFNSTSSLLCASSSNGTIHIFDLDPSSKVKESVMNNYRLLKLWNSEGAFQRIHVDGGVQCVCAFSPKSLAKTAAAADAAANHSDAGGGAGADLSGHIVALCNDGQYVKYVFSRDGHEVEDRRQLEL